MTERSKKDDLDLTFEEIGAMLDEGTPTDPAPTLPGNATLLLAATTVGTGARTIIPGVGARVSVSYAPH